MAAEEQLLIFEGASDGRYPQRSRPSEQRHNDERWEPRRSLRSSPKDETVGRRRGKNRQMASALWVAVITGRGLCWLRGYSPLRGCAREAALPAAHSSRNGLYAIYSAVPYSCGSVLHGRQLQSGEDRLWFAADVSRRKIRDHNFSGDRYGLQRKLA